MRTKNRIYMHLSSPLLTPPPLPTHTHIPSHRMVQAMSQVPIHNWHRSINRNNQFDLCHIQSGKYVRELGKTAVAAAVATIATTLNSPLIREWISYHLSFSIRIC